MKGFDPKIVMRGGLDCFLSSAETLVGYLLMSYMR